MARRQGKTEHNEDTVFESVIKNSHRDFINLVTKSYLSRFETFAEPGKELVISANKASLKSPEDEDTFSDNRCEEVPASA
jgi:hypothetical protein